ncbi:hypothetical protein AYO44_13340 [Planctomycetaceae bacterium SCGC AG-212-F19]|nr:hypothetical protein AYO44_13340 [Planctomycetaceae bacterium SCGC AG-212-F19]
MSYHCECGGACNYCKLEKSAERYQKDSAEVSALTAAINQVEQEKNLAMVHLNQARMLKGLEVQVKSFGLGRTGIQNRNLATGKRPRRKDIEEQDPAWHKDADDDLHNYDDQASDQDAETHDDDTVAAVEQRLLELEAERQALLDQLCGENGIDPECEICQEQYVSLDQTQAKDQKDDEHDEQVDEIGKALALQRQAIASAAKAIQSVMAVRTIRNRGD